MTLLDAMLFLGRDKGSSACQVGTVESMRGAFDRYGIDAGLVVASACHTLAMDLGNAQVFEAAGAEPRILPCPGVRPRFWSAAPDEAANVESLVAQGARAVCLFPDTWNLSLDELVMGPLFRTLEERHLPVLLFETQPAQARPVAERHPRLPILLPDINTRTRTWLPALRGVRNLYAVMSPALGSCGNLRVLCGEIGTERVLFASSFPRVEPGANVAWLMQSELDDEQAAAVGGGNLCRLLEAARGASALPPPAPRPAQPPNLGPIAGDILARRPLSLDGVVDMHVHMGKWALFEMRGEADDLVAEMDRVGIEKSFVSHHSCLSPEVRWGNDQVLDAMQRFPGRYVGYATCCPVTDELGIGEVRRCLDAGMRGIKLHNSAGYAYTDERYAPVWSLANERGLPVLLHTWGGLDSMECLFRDYPNAIVLLGHAGCADPEGYVKTAREYPNTYLEICYSRAPYGLVEYFVQEVGAERVLFGTDAPWLPYAYPLGRVAFADISEEDKHTILVENPRRILGTVE